MYQPLVSCEAGGIFIIIFQKGMITMTGIPVIDMAATGRNIAQLRTSAGISVRDMQNIFGFSTPQAIYKWQHGDALPTIDNLVILAAVLGVRMDDIIVFSSSVQPSA